MKILLLTVCLCLVTISVAEEHNRIKRSFFGLLGKDEPERVHIKILEAPPIIKYVDRPVTKIEYIEKKVPVPVPVYVNVPKPYPVEVEKKVPYIVEKKIPYPVEKPTLLPIQLIQPVQPITPIQHIQPIVPIAQPQKTIESHGYSQTHGTGPGGYGSYAKTYNNQVSFPNSGQSYYSQSAGETYSRRYGSYPRTYNSHSSYHTPYSNPSSYGSAYNSYPSTYSNPSSYSSALNSQSSYPSNPLASNQWSYPTSGQNYYNTNSELDSSAIAVPVSFPGYK